MRGYKHITYTKRLIIEPLINKKVNKMEIKAYITDELCSEKSTINTVKKIMKRIRQLADFPEISAPISSIINLDVPYCFLFCCNYTAFCKADGDEVHIIRVLYGRRNFMQILFGRSYDEYKKN